MKVTPQLQVEPELGKFLRRLTPDELALLESSLLAEGVRDPLVVWRRNGERVLLDGHHRYEIARRHGLEFRVQEIELADLAAAKRWVIRNQLGRRNLTPAEVAYYRGCAYLEEKDSWGGPRASGQNDHLKTCEVLADQHGVGEKTIRRDAAFAAALDRQAELHGEEFRAAVLSREAKITKSDVERLDDFSAEDPEKARRIIHAVLSGQAKDVREALREANRSEKLASLSDSTLPAGKFALIYADPPWRYDFAMDENRAIENHYPTMRLEELQALPVAARSKRSLRTGPLQPLERVAGGSEGVR